MSEHASLLIAQILLAVLLCGIVIALLVLPPELEGQRTGVDGAAGAADSTTEAGLEGTTGTATERTSSAGADMAPATEEGSATDEGPLFVSARTVKASLQSRPDLIPYEGELGGTMGFYNDEAVEVLSDEYVFARFSDGHVQGAMVLEYEVLSPGEIRWEVLSATLDR